MLKVFTSTNNPINHAHLPTNDKRSPVTQSEEFNDAMAKLAFSIAIVTACHHDVQLGRTITSFMPLNDEPPHVMIAISVVGSLMNLIGSSQRFSVSFLSTGQERLGEFFADKGLQGDQFPPTEWDYWPSGSLKLVGALLCLDCELVGSIDVGDHMLFVGTITQSEITDDRDPLLWRNRGYFSQTLKG